MKLSQRWDQFGTSIFSIMSQKAAAAGAINLAQGFPNFDGPEPIKQAAYQAIQSGLNQYAPAAGLPDLRQKIAQRQAARYDLHYDPQTEVTVFSGATEALFCALLGLFEKGDEVVCFEPFYDSYPAGLFAAGATLRTIPLRAPNWRFDPDQLAAAINLNTRALLINTPHNPTGMVLNAEERDFIAKLAITHDLLVITDDVYEEIVFGVTHVPLATLPGMRERTLTISSFSKTFSMTGWKVGYAFAPEAVTARLRSVHQFTVFCSSTPLQAGMLAALELGSNYFDEFRAEYCARRDRLVAILQDVGFKVTPPEGSYFILADYSPFSDAPDLQFADELIANAGVATVPVSPFTLAGAKSDLRYVRFAFCKDLATIEQAGKQLSDKLKLRSRQT